MRPTYASVVVGLAIILALSFPAAAAAADAARGPNSAEGEGPDPGVGPVQTPAQTLRARAEAWGRLTAPTRSPEPQAIGAYANGCLQGAAQLPPSGPGFEVLHLARNRRFGHPLLIDYIKRLGAFAKQKKLGPLLVGDLSQPRGGPTPSGHRSHQSGLDVDLGYTQPPWMLKRKITTPEREISFPPPVLDLKTQQLMPAWDDKIERLLESAARDPMIERIFVHPAIKRKLCQKARATRPWLRVLRPWWGHHDHFHARLRCPPDSAYCENQDPLPVGDGCDDLTWWLGDATRPKEPKKPTPPPPEPKAPPPMPTQCQDVFDTPDKPLKADKATKADKRR